MEDRYLGIYRDRTNRQINFDYGSSNSYFITLVVKNRHKTFGEIEDEEVILSEMGETVKYEWLKTFEMRKTMNLEQGAFVIMPDHFHAVITIGPNEHNKERIKPNKMGVTQSQTLGSIVRGFKAAVTTYARKKGIAFDWQADYHDRIIRNPRECLAIEKYIRDNPKNYGKKKKSSSDI